jgi:hypothetical protein
VTSDWIKTKAALEKQRDNEQTLRLELQQREATLVKALGGKFIEGLQNVINADIVEWNSSFPDRQINGAGKLPNGFSVSKAGFPKGEAEVKFNPDTLRIEVRLERPTMADLGKRYVADGYFHLKANPSLEQIYMIDHYRSAHVSAEDFSKIILESIADPHSHHTI